MNRRDFLKRVRGTAFAAGLFITVPTFAPQRGGWAETELDDYFEGPITYKGQVGWYTKIGNIVTINK